MRKLDAKYIFWKVLIHLLVTVMTLAFGVMISAVLENNDVSPEKTAKWVSGLTLFLFLLFQYWLIQRSDLSRISKKLYILGEGTAFAILSLFLGVILLIAGGKGMTPKPLGGFSPAPLFFAYLWQRIDLGVLTASVVYPLVALFLYAVKKKKDPTLLGAKKNFPKEDRLTDQPEDRSEDHPKAEQSERNRQKEEENGD